MPIIGGVNVPNDALEADLSGLGLVAFPNDILTVTTLRSLRLDDNDIPSIPVGLTALVNLEDFHIARNQLSTVPAELAAMDDQLRDFDIAENPITTLPTDVQRLLSYNLRNPQIHLTYAIAVTNVPAGATASVTQVNW